MKSSVLAIGLCLWSSAVCAQKVDRLIVTGRPVTAPPISLTVLDGPFEAFIAPRAPAELVNRAPGVLVQAGSGREHLTAIRSPVLTGGAGAGSFLFLQDGIPLRASGFSNVNGLFHAAFPLAEAVRVVRGPGDVAYGSNALHGAIDVVTPAPGEATSRASISYGSFDRLQGVAAYGGEAATMGLSVLDDGGYRADSGAVEVKAAGAAEAGPGTLRFSLHDLDQETAGYVLGDEAFRVDGLRRSNPNPEAFRNVRHGLISYEMPFEAGGWRGVVTPYARWTDMEFKLHFFPGDALEENEHASLGFQSLAVREILGSAELSAGFDLDLTEGSLREFQEEPTVFSFVEGLHYDYRVDAVEAAPFAKIAFQPTPKLDLQAGLRGTFTRYDYDNEAPAGSVGRYFRPADREDGFSVLTGRLGARYEAAEGTALTVSLARGARPPQTAELYRLQPGQRIAGIDPETLDAAELGLVQDLGGRGLLSVTGFAMVKRNVIFRDADGFNVTDAETTHVGVEAEVSAALTDTLRLEGSATYAEHRYGFASGDEGIGEGDLVDTAPRTLASARLLWNPATHWRAELAFTHVGRYAMDPANTRFYDGHDLLDLRVERQLTDRVALTGIARNLFDTRYARRADFAFGNERYFPGEERAYEAVLSAKF